jgi:Tol biopolymer transport system component
MSWSYSPSLSANGRYVAFYSDAENLVTGDTNNAPDIFVRDRQTATTARVSVATGNIQGNRGSYSQALSDDGRFVAFDSFAYNWSAAIPTMRRTSSYTTVRPARPSVSVATDGTQANVWGSHAPALNADGRYVAFASYVDNLVSDDTNGVPDIFVHDRQTGTTTRVSVASDGTHECAERKAVLER